MSKRTDELEEQKRLLCERLQRLHDRNQELTAEVANLTSELMAVENYQEELRVLRAEVERLKVFEQTVAERDLTIQILGIEVERLEAFIMHVTI